MIESFHTVELSDAEFAREGLRMATVRSRALGQRADVSVWMPQAERVDTLLILLHGVYGSHWAWSLKGGAHRTAQRMTDAGDIAPLIIAMPSDGLGGDGSGYLTWPDVQDVERWIVEEVPLVAQLAAPALLSNAKVAIAGLSMGGYGALRLGAKYADRFCAISAHSAITDIVQIEDFVQEPLSNYLACAPREELSVLHWLRASRDCLPPLRFDCGVDDHLVTGNRVLHQALVEDGIAHEYREYSGGHAWPYWQEHIAETLRFVNRHCHE